MADALAQLDPWVASFEDAWHDSGRVRIADHVPPRDHPDFARVLRALVRIDLENQRRAGRRPSLDDYRREFPELAADAGSLAGAADDAAGGGLPAWAAAPTHPPRTIILNASDPRPAKGESGGPSPA
jgi:hypothetical protein